jgi:hypothetical protein
VVHETHYDYAARVTQAWHVAHLKPLHDATQRLLAHTLHVDPDPGPIAGDVDDHGNARCFFSLAQPHRIHDCFACCPCPTPSASLDSRASH